MRPQYDFIRKNTIPVVFVFAKAWSINSHVSFTVASASQIFEIIKSQVKNIKRKVFDSIFPKIEPRYV